MKTFDLRQTIALLAAFVLGVLSNQIFLLLEGKTYAKSKQSKKFEYRRCTEVGVPSDFSGPGTPELKVNQLGKEGWEVISFQQRDSFYEYFLKREYE